MLSLAYLKQTRIGLGVPRRALANVTSIQPHRLKQLEIVKQRSEPWLDEAAALARALGVPHIISLVTIGERADLDLGPTIGDEVEMLRAGVRLPLSVGFRIANLLGVPDPIHLIAGPVQMQVWDILQASERHPTASGWCPWCAADIHAGEPHHKFCLPANLWTRDLSKAHTIIARPRVSTRGSIMGASGPGYGLRAFRESYGITQKELAEAVGIAPNYYARLERTGAPLTTSVAQRIAAHFNADTALLYRKTAEDAAHVELAADLGTETQWDTETAPSGPDEAPVASPAPELAPVSPATGESA